VTIGVTKGGVVAMDPHKYTGAAWPLVLAMLVGIYGYWAVQREFISSRPIATSAHDVPEPVSAPGVRSLHSRLWEDPLSASYEHWKLHAASGRPAVVQDSELQLQGEQREKLAIKALDDLTRKSTQTDTADGNNGSKDDQSSADNAGRFQASEFTSVLAAWCRSVLSAATGNQEEVGGTIKRFFADITRDTDTVVLPVFLPGSPYAEDKETRLRIRYAVVTALAESGYHLELSRRMSYLTTKIYVRVLNGWQEREIVVPVKLYQSGPQKPQVLVFWINESELGGQPLLATSRILNQVFESVGDPERLKISMIGPSDSGVLKEMAAEMKALSVATNAVKSGKVEPFGLIENERALHWFLSSYRRDPTTLHGFAPLLTLPALNQRIDLFSCRATKTFEQQPGDELLFREDSPITLHRIIGTDLQLAHALKEELNIRGALHGRVALISEHDTAYGRAIQATFETAFFGAETELQTFKILRGVDGKRPNGNGSHSGSDHNEQESGRDSALAVHKIVERSPDGRSQYDYLRRLVRRIEGTSDTKPIKAIGVVGSDVYDKLLVLRALRPKFPNCVFFTTDLDAIYSHADERQHTRNLLIASHFALNLGETLQPQTPPFRDSYQTATFLATRLAVRDGQRHFETVTADNEEHDWRRVDKHCLSDNPGSGSIQPVVHVVGRNQLHRLSQPLNDVPEKQASTSTVGPGEPVESIIHPKMTHNAGARHYLFAFGVALVACCFVCWQRLRDRSLTSPLGQEQRNRSVRIVLAILFAGGSCLAVIFFGRGLYGLEAGSIVDGYSTWPTKVLYSLVGIAAVGTAAHMIDQWYQQLNEIRLHRGLVSRRACGWFGEADNLKMGILAVTIAYVAGVVVCPLDTWHFWLAAAAMIFVLALVWVQSTNKRAGSHAGNSTDPSLNAPPNTLVVGSGVRAALGSALIFMVVVTLVRIGSAELLDELGASLPSNRWHPAYVSRGLFSRQGDWMASIYGFGAVGLLLALLLYLQVWSREFADHVLRHDDEERDSVEQMRVEFEQEVSEEDLATELKNKYDQLWVIGKLTATTGNLVPMLLAMLFVLVIAYHPWISPVSMPSSLLVLATLYVVVFVVSRLSLRWSMHRERDNTLDQLDLRYSELYDPIAELAAPSQAVGNDREIPGQLQFRVDELLEVIESDGVQTRATATSLKTARPEAKRDQREQMKKLLQARKEQIADLSDGVFQSWNRSPMGWVLGGGTTLALLDLWIRWWTIGI
jgi:hypothetical protein